MGKFIAKRLAFSAVIFFFVTFIDICDVDVY